MKKIGIITWFKYENYGTLLQAFAIYKFITNLGYDAYFIDIDVIDSSDNIKSKSLYKLIGNYIFKLEYHLNKKIFIVKSDKFAKFIKDNFKLTAKINNEKEYIRICNEFDVIVCGSDQIWNPNWYNPFYYANFNGINSKLVSYASSFGVNYIPDSLIEVYRNAISKFDSISVRESEGNNIISNLGNYKSLQVVDPTLLINREEWMLIEKKNIKLHDDYIFCYMLSDNKYHWSAIKKYAKKNNLKLVIIPHEGHSYVNSKYVYKSAGVEDFLTLIHNSKFVITDSYHAIIFSVIYKKNIVVFQRHDENEKNNQNSRINNILNICGIDNVLLKYNTSKISKVANINYNKVWSKLEKNINVSKDYLINSLKK